MDNSLDKAKIDARRILNSLSPHEAQEIVNKVLNANELKPDLEQEIDWDEIPIPASWQEEDG